MYYKYLMPASISLRLPSDAARALEQLARSLDRSKTYVMRKALDAYLQEYADYQVALDRMRDKDDPVISSAELRKRLGR
jgi:RHH-type rel operon transcriptional repressor/antitoxin RelB